MTAPELDSMVTLPYHEDRMHDGSAPDWRPLTAPDWRHVIDQYQATLADALTTQLNFEIEKRVSGAVEVARGEAATDTAAAVAAEHRRMEAETVQAIARAVDETRESAAQELIRALAQERARSRAELENALAEVSAMGDAEVAAAVTAERTRLQLESAKSLALAVDETLRKVAESLNQTLRRIRQTSAEHETLQLLLEGSADFADRAVVLLIENNQASVAAFRNVSFCDEEEDRAPLDLREAAAIASCAETNDPVVTIASVGEVSSLLASALSPGGADKIYLFPVVVRQSTVAMLLACGSVSPSANELLCEASGMKLEAFSAAQETSPFAEAEPLVQIAAAAPAEKAESSADSWAALTPQEQAAHLRAQRMARVRVAQMRISESEALRKGIQTGDIYSALRQSIDAAREDYRQTYTSQSASIVDYLHVEIVRSLAHDDVELLGHDYPGPIV